jgi:hypothetical protein
LGSSPKLGFSQGILQGSPSEEGAIVTLGKTTNRMIDDQLARKTLIRSL